VSRVPRFQEHLKTGFASEAASAARCRAYAAIAERDGQPQLAAAWRQLAADKDELAILQLEATGLMRRQREAVADALAEERFENDVLYPKMISEVGGDAAAVFQRVVESQRSHAERLEGLRRSLQEAAGDIA